MTSPRQIDRNLQRFESKEVVSHYAEQNDLQPCEAYLFERYLKPGLIILDIGVGGGRTTPYLAKNAARYVGTDYSKAMVEACHQRFPGLDFLQCDATDMAEFEDGSFDAVVFSFNGIDYIPTNERREQCLAEIARVLKRGGIFIFSSHNARMIGCRPLFAGATPYQVMWRSLLSIYKTSVIIPKLLYSGSYIRGEGYIRDPVHGTLHTYVSTPRAFAPQLNRAGLDLEEAVGGPYLSVRPHALAKWFYYACRKRAAASYTER